MFKILNGNRLIFITYKFENFEIIYKLKNKCRQIEIIYTSFVFENI